MNLNELKSMIAEEYKNYMAEQPVPGIAVSNADVDATGGGDAESTLRDVYETLKAYFEDGAEADTAETEVAQADAENANARTKAAQDKLKQAKA